MEARLFFGIMCKKQEEYSKSIRIISKRFGQVNRETDKFSKRLVYGKPAKETVHIARSY